MKKYYFTDTVENETVIIKADDEDTAWVLLTQRHSNMGKEAIRTEDAKERYKINKMSN